MPGWVREFERVAIGIHVPVVRVHVHRVRYNCIRADELADHGIIVACLHVDEAGSAIDFMPGELVLGVHEACPLCAVGVVLRTAGDAGGEDGAAEVVGVEVGERVRAHRLRDALPGEEVGLGDCLRGGDAHGVVREVVELPPRHRCAGF